MSGFCEYVKKTRNRELEMLGEVAGEKGKLIHRGNCRASPLGNDAGFCKQCGSELQFG
ncbi:MAG: hypothetical protein JRJ14_05410 [Deltaproteobacteria bacterium]|nr:hypothetical protein [Deltaproteobacteria bacterium]